MNIRFGEEFAIIGSIDPVDTATSAATSDWVAMNKWTRIAAIGLVGNLTGTLDAKLQAATDSSGTGAADITGASITQLAAASGDNKQFVIDIPVTKTNLTTQTHVACVVTPTGGTANLIAVVIVGYIVRNAPVSSDDIASVAQIVIL